MIAAVVLAAGKSSRMGQDKALLPFRNSSFLEEILFTLEKVPVQRVVVVLGHNAPQICSSVSFHNAEIAVNSNYQKGQTSSLLVGLEAVESTKLEGILLCLVDHPLISVKVVRRLQDEFRAKEPLLAIPTYQGKSGHPVVFSRALFGEFRDLASGEGANLVSRRHHNETLFVEVHENGILKDVDTPADYEALTPEGK